MNLEKLMQNPKAWAFLSLCTIIALIIAVASVIKGRKRKFFEYAHSTFTVIRGGENMIDGLQLLYQNNVIDNISITKIALWNKGTETIHSSDVVSTRPLIISCNNDVKILDAQIIVENELSNKFFIKEISDHSIELSFEYADPKEGIVIQVLHTGDPNGLKVDVKIMGGQDIKCIDNFRHANLNKKSKLLKLLNKLKRIYDYLQVFIAIVVVLFLNVSTFWLHAMNYTLLGNIMCDIVMCVFIDILLILAVWVQYNIMNKPVPSDLRVYDQFDKQ